MKQDSVIQTFAPEQTYRMLHHFLLHGYLTEDVQKVTRTEFLMIIDAWVSDKENIDYLKKLWPIVEDENVQRRMAWQLNEEILSRLVMVLQDIEERSLKEIKDDALAIYSLGRKNYEISDFFTLLKTALVAVLSRQIEKRWDEVFAAHIMDAMIIANPAIFEDLERNNTRLYSTAFIPVIERIKSRGISSYHGRAITDNLRDIKSNAGNTETGNIIIENAGILNYIIPIAEFFRKQNISDSKKLVRPEKAVSLIYFMQTGTDVFAEYEAVLGKILCGIKFHKPIRTDKPLTTFDKHKCNEFLLSLFNDNHSEGEGSLENLRAIYFNTTADLQLKNNEWLIRPRAGSGGTENTLHENLIKLPWMTQRIRLSNY